jgi:hypothetical protein
MLTIQSQLFNSLASFRIDTFNSSAIDFVVSTIAPLKIVGSIVSLALVLMIYLWQIVGVRDECLRYQTMHEVIVTFAIVLSQTNMDISRSFVGAQTHHLTFAVVWCEFPGR